MGPVAIKLTSFISIIVIKDGGTKSHASDSAM